MKVTNETSVLLRHGKEGENSKGYYYEGPQGQQLFRAQLKARHQ